MHRIEDKSKVIYSEIKVLMKDADGSEMDKQGAGQ